MADSALPLTSTHVLAAMISASPSALATFVMAGPLSENPEKLA